ncbi:MAG: glutamate mutase L [Candidatus Muirbacterium halophilum]|nr:glutamate mutase L [Candidatus Muirbacterium halophilum]MCK9474562.1 glutamate mutase L [Candidatus Muirbacterium halophilum]
MKIDIITVEIGSTITKVNAFNNIFTDNPIHIAQATDLTTVEQGDVTLGAYKALENLNKIAGEKLEPKEILINSSAAGGLSMGVFGLTYDMTAKAASEASLGAGAIIKYIGCGKIQPYQIDELLETKPNIILFAGGLDFGDTETTYHNALMLCQIPCDIPFIYAGNTQLIKAITKLFEKQGKNLLVTKNVYPGVDELDTEPARKIIQETFSKHIIHAQGMEKLSLLTKKPIIPTPYAVLKITEKIYETMGDVVVIDVGGATTDIHSVCEDTPEHSAKRIEAEPLSKRTVEGDLGVFINADNLNKLEDKTIRFHGDLGFLKPMPDSESSIALSKNLAYKAVKLGLYRHAGKLKTVFTPSGKKQFVIGKDLSNVKYIIGTGGALTRLPGCKTLLEPKNLLLNAESLMPGKDAESFIDNKYIFSSLGTIAFHYPDINIKKLVLSSINSKEQ